MQKKPKKEKVEPVKCICGSPPAIVRNRGKKLVSCPNPVKCKGNICTNWHPNEEAAVVQWNALVAAAAAKRSENNA